MTKQSRDVYKAMEAACAYFGCVCADAQSVQGETLTPACTTVPPQLMNTKEREQARETTGRTFLVQSPLPNHLCNRNMNCGGGFASTLLHRLWGSHINVNRQLAEPNIINSSMDGGKTTQVMVEGDWKRLRKVILQTILLTTHSELQSEAQQTNCWKGTWPLFTLRRV
jgi:hypothetical protein